MKQSKQMRYEVMSAVLAGAVGALASNTVAVAGVLGFDPTGVYEGVQRCQFFDDFDAKTSVKIDDLLLVTYNATTGNVDVLSQATGIAYTGFPVSDPNDPERKGRLGLMDCDTRLPPGAISETVEFDKVDTMKGTLKGKSIFINGDIPGTGSCKWNFTRVDMEDPGVGHCEPLELGPEGAALLKHGRR